MTNKQAIEILKHECYVFNPLDFDNTTRINRALDVAVKVLEQEPKTGRWEYIQYDGNPNIGNWHCSECKNIAYKDVDRKWKYCPNCGCRMEV